MAKAEAGEVEAEAVKVKAVEEEAVEAEAGEAKSLRVEVIQKLPLAHPCFRWTSVVCSGVFA